MFDVTIPAQDCHIRTRHLRDHLRPASATADETVGLHNCRISLKTVKNLHGEVYPRTCHPLPEFDLTPA